MGKKAPVKDIHFFSDLNASVRALGGYRLQPAFTPNFRTSWGQFHAALTTMKETYRRYREAMVVEEGLNRLIPAQDIRFTKHVGAQGTRDRVRGAVDRLYKEVNGES